MMSKGLALGGAAADAYGSVASTASHYVTISRMRRRKPMASWPSILYQSHDKGLGRMVAHDGMDR